MDHKTDTDRGREALDRYLKDCDTHAIVPDVGGAFHAAFMAGRASPPLPGAQEAVAWMRRDGMRAMVADEKDGWIAEGRANIVEDYTKPLYAAPQPAAPYSMDADPQGIRATVADAITGALAFGAQGVNRPPEGHWLAPFWNAVREDMAAPQPALSAGWVSVKDRLPPPFDEVWVHPRPSDYCCEASVDTVGNWKYSEYETNFGVNHIKCTVEYWMQPPALPVEPSMDGESNG